MSLCKIGSIFFFLMRPSILCTFGQMMSHHRYVTLIQQFSFVLSFFFIPVLFCCLVLYYYYFLFSHKL